MTAILPRRLLLASAAAALALPPMTAAQARTGPDSFAPLVKRVLPTVVNIATTETVAGNDPFAMFPPEMQRQLRERFKQRRQEVSGAGSGFVIDASGIIVTNNHVIRGADRVIVSFSDGTQLPARLIGLDELTDLAVLRVTPAKPLVAASWGDSRALEVGDWVIAAGNPFGLGGSISAGIVSARGRDLGVGIQDDFIQIDAPINPGNSGGPLFDTEGRVVGINTAIFSPTGSSVGIGFSIPAEIAQKVVAELRANGRVERGWLGVQLQDVPAGPRNGAAAGVAIVEQNSPAARAGLRPGDVVVAINGTPSESARGLIRAVAALSPGAQANLLVIRQGRPIELNLTVGRRPRPEEN
jgi:serine protease Do